MSAFVGKSGPFTKLIALARVSSGVASGFSRAQHVAATTSPRLCGGMFVAIPTAIPADPLTRRFGKREGRTVGSWERPS